MTKCVDLNVVHYRQWSYQVYQIPSLQISEIKVLWFCESVIHTFTLTDVHFVGVAGPPWSLYRPWNVIIYYLKGMTNGFLINIFVLNLKFFHLTCAFIKEICCEALFAFAPHLQTGDYLFADTRICKQQRPFFANTAHIL